MAKAQVTNEEILSTLSQFADNVDKRFDKIEDDIAELKSDVAELKSDVAELKSDVNRIYGILDTHMSRIETLIQETKVQAHQQARLERWIFQLADQAGVHLKYDG
jgi:septal ring factor EnvC (AmiA/AmiB activator)